MDQPGVLQAGTDVISSSDPCHARKTDTVTSVTMMMTLVQLLR